MISDTRRQAKFCATIEMSKRIDARLEGGADDSPTWIVRYATCWEMWRVLEPCRNVLIEEYNRLCGEHD